MRPISQSEWKIRLKELHSLPGYTELKLATPQGPRRTIGEWVLVAERLAAEHGDTLPHARWLQKNGYIGLYGAMKKDPKAFSHIPQKRYFQDLAVHVATAKKLERKHGKVPYQVWLVKHGFGLITQARRKHPDAFKGIMFATNEDRLQEALTLAVEQAEKLAKKNGNVLPTLWWLKQHGYYGVAHVLQKHPNLLSHLKLAVVGQHRSVTEWVRLAAKLEKKHGKVPCYSWLHAHGYLLLERMMYTRPEKFSHLKQDTTRLRRKVEEWLKIAKKIAPNGVLPTGKELSKRGLGGLQSIVSRHPRLFKRFKRAPRRRAADGKLL